MIKKILKNQSFIKITNQIVLRFATLFFGLLISRLVINFLPTETYVKYSLFTDSINNLVLLVISLSIPQIIQKYYTNYSKDSDVIQNGRFWTTMWILRIGSYFLGLVIAMGMFYILQFSNDNLSFDFENILILVGLYSVQYLLVVDNSFRGIYDATGRGWIFNFTDTLSKGVFATSLFGFSYFTSKELFLNLFIYIGIISYLLSNFLDYYFNRDYIRWGRVDWSILAQNRSVIINISLSGILIYFYTFSFQYIFFFNNLSDYQIANFSNAYNRVFISLLSVLSFVFSQYSTKLKLEFDKKNISGINSIWKLVGAFSISYFIFAQVAGRLVLYFLDNQNLYPESVQLFQILSFGLLIYPTNIVLTNFFIFIHKDKYELINSLFLAAVGVISIYSLSKLYGVTGAAIALVGIAGLEFSVRLYLYFKIKKYLL